MKNYWHIAYGFLLVIAFGAALPSLSAAAEDEAPFGLERRIPWNTSRVIGSPEPPLPYTVEKIFTNIHWRLPMFVISEPNTDSLFVIQQGGSDQHGRRVHGHNIDPLRPSAESLSSGHAK